MIIVLAACATAYAVVLQATGQPSAAERFVMWAGGGLTTFAVFVYFFSPDED